MQKMLLSIVSPFLPAALRIALHLATYHFGIHLVSGRSTALPAVEALPGAIANYAALPGTSFFGVRRIPFVLRARASAFRGAAQSGRR
jgi:hypothetical protein